MGLKDNASKPGNGPEILKITKLLLKSGCRVNVIQTLPGNQTKNLRVTMVKDTSTVANC